MQWPGIEPRTHHPKLFKDVRTDVTAIPPLRQIGLVIQECVGCVGTRVGPQMCEFPLENLAGSEILSGNLYLKNSTYQ